MRKVIMILIPFVLWEQLLFCQSFLSRSPGYLSYCVKSKTLKPGDLNKIYPFNKNIKIELVSFKPDYESIPKKNGQIDTTKFIETKTLSHQEEEELIDILYNYNYDPKVNRDSIIGEINICYEPRNAILFRNKKNKIITYLEICFECLQYRKPKRLKIGDFCQEKFDLLKDHFKRVGIKFGTIELD